MADGHETDDPSNHTAEPRDRERPQGDQPEGTALTPELRRRLFVEWLYALCDREYGVAQYDNSDVGGTLNLQDGRVVKVAFVDGPPSVTVEQEAEPLPTALVDEAQKRTEVGDLGAGTWWTLGLSADVNLYDLANVHFMRIANEHKRYQGPWRFGTNALLEFEQADVAPAPIVMRKFKATITFHVPGPAHGPFGRLLAEGVGAFFRALVALASAAPLRSGNVFPAKDQAATEAAQAVTAGTVSEMVVEDIPLWPAMLRLFADGAGVEGFRRAQGAIYAYEQALDQRSEYVTLILLVSSIEALLQPNQPWQLRRLVKRFTAGTPVLASVALREILTHDNVAQAFGSAARNERRLLENLYSRRSRPLHTGHMQHGLGLPMGDPSIGIRIMLTSMLTRAAILNFLRAPFSSCYGHPVLDPDRTDE